MLVLVSPRLGHRAARWTRQSEWREGPVQHSSVRDNGRTATAYTGTTPGTATTTAIATADTDTYIGTGSGTSTGTDTGRCSVARSLLHGPKVSHERK